MRFRLATQVGCGSLTHSPVRLAVRARARVCVRVCAPRVCNPEYLDRSGRHRPKSRRRWASLAWRPPAASTRLSQHVAHA
jgi:hypothetical protein